MKRKDFLRSLLGIAVAPTIAKNIDLEERWEEMHSDPMDFVKVSDPRGGGYLVPPGFSNELRKEEGREHFQQ